MRAIKFNEKVILEQTNIPALAEGEALVRVALGGICNTDIEITKGYMGFQGTLGHEFVGVVEKTFDGSTELVGKRVVGEINCACGECDFCRKNIPTHCTNRTVIGIFNKDGCFGDYINMPIKNLIVVPDNVTNEEAVFVEPLAAGIEILEQLHIKPSDKVLVLGDGKLGLLTSLGLHASGVNVLLCGKHQKKIDIAKNQGVKTVLLDDLVQDRSFDVVVEATGSIHGFDYAIKAVRPRGVIVLKSTVASGKEFNFAPIVIDEITILGSRCGRFEPALRLLESKTIDVTKLIDATFNADDAVAAFEKSVQQNVLKVIIDFQ